MVSQGLLDQNVFTLKLPSDDSDTGDGGITFGGTNKDRYSGDLTRVPPD